MIPNYLRAPHLATLWKETHRRLSTGARVTSVRLRGLTDDERHALAELLGVDRLPTADARIVLDAVREAIRPCSLEAVLTVLIGPIDDATRRRSEAADERRELWAWLESHPLMNERPALRAWAARIRAEPVLGTVAETRGQLSEALKVLAALPADRLPLPVLAQRCLNDPHALDDGRVPTLVLRAIAVETGNPEPFDSEQRRRTWVAAGVVTDDLSSTVLVAGLAPEGDTLLATVLRAARAEGEATQVTLAQLRNGPGAFAPDRTRIFVVENPSIMQAALNHFGSSVPALVCVSGRLHVAARILLRSLAESGGELRYHGDFDPTGVSIAADVAERFGARLWRMGAADYLSALGPGPRFDPTAVPATPWDDFLAEVMRREGVAVYEEAVVDELLGDLDHHRGGAA